MYQIKVSKQKCPVRVCPLPQYKFCVSNPVCLSFLFRLPSGEAVGDSRAGLCNERGWTFHLSVLNGYYGARSH